MRDWANKHGWKLFGASLLVFIVCFAEALLTSEPLGVLIWFLGGSIQLWFIVEVLTKFEETTQK